MHWVTEMECDQIDVLSFLEDRRTVAEKMPQNGEIVGTLQRSKDEVADGLSDWLCVNTWPRPLRR